jgi:pimeloyl-ACP methyl ester carboxylesterase
MDNIFKSKLTDEEIEEWVAIQFNTETGIETPSCFREAIRLAKGEARTFIGESLRNLKYRDELKAIEKINTPLAILHGEKDRCINLEYLKEIKFPSLWRNEIQVIAGAGHSPQWEKSEVFNTLVEEFIDDINH